MNKFEQLIEYIINEDEAKAKALFHEIVIEKSRDIYESMIDDDTHVGGNQVERLMQDVSMDEEGVQESDEEMDDVEMVGDEDSMDDIDSDADMDDEIEFGGDAEGDMEIGDDDFGAEGSEDDLDDRVMDLESALDELRAEFDALMGSADIDGDGDHDMDDHEAEEDSEEGPEEVDDEAGMPKEGVVREYVEKVSAPAKGEGQPAGAKNTSPASVNAKSIVAGKNDMGGTTTNIARGGSESAPDGTNPTKKPSNQYTKGQGNLPHAGKYENVPGARAGQAFGRAAKPSTSQGAPAGAKNTMGSSVNDKSVIESRRRKS